MNQNDTRRDPSQATVGNKREYTPGGRKEVRRETEVHSNFKPTPDPDNCADHAALKACSPIQP